MPDVKVLANGNVLVSIPIILRESAGRKRIITDEKKFKADEDPIVLNIARGFYWQEMIDNGKIANVRELANILNVNESYVARTIRLSMLSPEIIHRAIRGTLPPDISLAKLYKLSSRWDGLRNTFSVNSLKSSQYLRCNACSQRAMFHPIRFSCAVAILNKDSLIGAIPHKKLSIKNL